MSEDQLRWPTNNALRFFLPEEYWKRENICIQNKELFHKMERVLHLRVGDCMIALKNDGKEYLIELTLVSKKHVEGLVRDERMTAEGERKITLYQALPQKAKFETILDFATEAGVTDIVPIISEKSLKGEYLQKSQDRFQRILESAAQQSGRGIIPQLHEVLPFAKAVEMEKEGEVFLCSPRAEKKAPLIKGVWGISEEKKKEEPPAFGTPLIRGAGGTSDLHLFIGPESGFSLAEEDKAFTAGCTPLSLGTFVFRVEYAAGVGIAKLFL